MTPTPEMQLFPAAALVLLWVLNWAGTGGQLICTMRPQDWTPWRCEPSLELPHSMTGIGVGVPAREGERAQARGESCVRFLEVTLNAFHCPSLTLPQSSLSQESPHFLAGGAGPSTVCRA